MEFTFDWTLIIVALLENIVPLLITALGAVIFKYLKSKGANDELLKLVQEAYTIFNKCVLNVNQTFVDALKSDGVFDAEAQEEARNMAKEMFMEMISEEMKLALRTLYGSIDKWIETVREADVWSAKKANI